MWYRCPVGTKDDFCLEVNALPSDEILARFPCTGTRLQCREQSQQAVYYAHSLSGECRCLDTDAETGCPIAPLGEEGPSEELAEITAEHLKRKSLDELKYLFTKVSGGAVDVGKYSSEESILKAMAIFAEKEAARRVLKERSDRAIENRKASNASRRKNLQTVHTIEVRLCKSSYGQIFKEMQAEWYLPNAEELNITVTEYPVPLFRKIAHNMCKVTFVACLGVSFVGQQLLPPAVMEHINQRRGLLLSTGFLLNALSGSLSQTGAFDLYVDGELMYSKMEVGKLPASMDVNRIILEKTLLHFWENVSTV